MRRERSEVVGAKAVTTYRVSPRRRSHTEGVCVVVHQKPLAEGWAAPTQEETKLNLPDC